MPELPEVQAVASAMNRLLAGDAIAGWHRFTPRLRREIPTAAEAAELLDRPFDGVRRVAKSLYLDFGLERYLRVHLGMTGYFVLAAGDSGKLGHEHLRLELASGRVLSFCDPRRFGVIEICTLPDEITIEPFAGELTADYLAEFCRKSRRSIKSLIMDQSIVAGPGNIYASEALFLAEIRPDRQACSLSETELQAVVAGLIEVVARAIASADAQMQLNGPFLNSETPHFPIDTKVYGRSGEKCCRCRTGLISAVRIAGRSSFFCPVCQK